MRSGIGRHEYDAIAMIIRLEETGDGWGDVERCQFINYCALKVKGLPKP